MPNFVAAALKSLQFWPGDNEKQSLATTQQFNNLKFLEHLKLYAVDLQYGEGFLPDQYRVIIGYRIWTLYRQAIKSF